MCSLRLESCCHESRAVLRCPGCDCRQCWCIKHENGLQYLYCNSAGCPSSTAQQALCCRSLVHGIDDGRNAAADWAVSFELPTHTVCTKIKSDNFCLSNAMHGQNINLPVCICLCVCHTFCQLAYRPIGQTPQRIFTVDSLTDTDLRKDVPFGGLDDE